MSPGTFGRWSWIPLVLLLASACESRDLVCEQARYFQVLKPDFLVRAAPFSIERLGAEVKSTDLERVPDALRLKSGNRVVVDWKSHGRVIGHSDLIFSPDDELAKSTSPDTPEDVYPMRHSPRRAIERVRFGFRALKCPDPDSCTKATEPLLLAAEMACHRE